VDYLLITREDGVTQIAGITMKKTKDKNACHKCGDKGRFLHKHTWWCAWENREGVFNLVGRCKNEKRERNYADRND
jgi:hypothetical protein